MQHCGQKGRITATVTSRGERNSSSEYHGNSNSIKNRTKNDNTHTYTGLTFVTVALICFTSKEQTHVIGGNDSVNISLLSDGQEVCTLIFIKRQLLNTADLYWNLKPSENMSIHL